MLTIGETRTNCDANEPQELATGGCTRDKRDSLREIKQQNSAQAAKKKETSGNHRAKTKDNITLNQLSTQPLSFTRFCKSPISSYIA